MRLTKVFGLLISLAVPLCFGQATNQIAITGYPAIRQVPISLQEAIQLALEHNLDLRIQRYAPAIFNYDAQALMGDYYDPRFTARWQRADNTSQGTAFSQTTGQAVPPSISQVDTMFGSLDGRLPTGMGYSIYNRYDETLRSSFQDFGAGLFRTRTNFWAANAGISVTQPLLRDFWIDNARLKIQLKKQDRRIEETKVELKAQTVVSDLVAAYYQLAGNLDAIKVSESDLQVKAQFFDETRRRVQVGSKAPLEETKAQAEVALARTALVKSRDSAADSEAKLKALISDDYSSLLGARLAPTDKLLLTPVLIDFPTSVRTALDKRPEILAERAELVRLNIQLKYTFNQLFPRLDVFATWEVNGTELHQGDAIDDLPRKDFQRDIYGAQITVPLSFWRERYDHRSAKLSKQQEILNLKFVEQKVIKDVDDAVRGVSSAYLRAKLSRDSVIFAEADLDAQQKKYAAGKATTLDVLTAASNLTKARNDEIQAIVDYNVSLSELTRAEGTALEERHIDFESAHRPKSIRVE